MTPLPANRYFPQQKDPRLNEDLRLVYQMAYDAHDRADQLHSQLQDAHKKLADAHAKLDAASKKPEPGGPSSTKIAGLNVHATPPQQGAAVANLSGKPVLIYDKASGELTWVIPA